MDKTKCIFCNNYVPKRKFDRHTKKCMKRSQKCQHCQTPSHKSDMPGHEKRCIEKYQYIENAEGKKICKICYRDFDLRKNVMIHIAKSHPNWQKLPKKSLPNIKTEDINIKHEEPPSKVQKFLVLNKPTSNVTIIVDKMYIFYAHKRLLAKYSAFFNNLFQTPETPEEIHSNCGWKTMSEFTR